MWTATISSLTPPRAARPRRAASCAPATTSAPRGGSLKPCSACYATRTLTSTLAQVLLLLLLGQVPLLLRLDPVLLAPVLLGQVLLDQGLLLLLAQVLLAQMLLMLLLLLLAPVLLPLLLLAQVLLLLGQMLLRLGQMPQ